MKHELTDEEYLELLKRQRARLDKLSQKDVWSDDCTMTGCKHTTTNVGLCDDGLATEELALWPKSWPHRKTMRSRATRHCCPLDQRVWNGEQFDLNGCFWKCMIFHRRWPIGASKKKRRVLRLDEIKKLYDLMIDMVEQGKFASWKDHREAFAQLLTGGKDAQTADRH